MRMLRMVCSSTGDESSMGAGMFVGGVSFATCGSSVANGFSSVTGNFSSFGGSSSVFLSSVGLSGRFNSLCNSRSRSIAFSGRMRW